MDHQFGDYDLSLEQRLKGLRSCLAFIREEALAYGQEDVAGHLAMACHILDGNVEMLSVEDLTSRRYS
ncbi:hypothetical protein [Telmatospirillum sp.]|uniref:hypothetical protein n=1 Tax=Telmatospirillum sp. TaxID=2079197 RepID=UPI00284D5859|nr:hypothetical protein [Telmatospirillum sp.]MDR3439671.1 hypothetical protein [Telmatospirillum sp.]